MNAQRFQGKVAVVTGGNSGIGLATARLFKQEGADVVIFGRDRKTLDAAVAELGGSTLGVQGNASVLADLDRLFAKTKERFKRIDVLFVNAGIYKMAPVAETPEALVDEVMDVNFKGAFFTAQKALPLLAQGASVVFNTSAATDVVMPGASVYSASKAALRVLMRTLAAELLDRSIRVNAVSPGPIETPIFGRTEMPEAARDEMGKKILQMIPMRRFGQADEVAKAVLFLASSDASFTTAAELTVDGGVVMLSPNPAPATDEPGTVESPNPRPKSLATQPR